MISPKTSQSLGRLGLFAASFILTASAASEPPTAHSQWVYPDRSGKLVYQPLKTGDRISDFSYAGYGGGGVALPTFPVKKTVAPSGEDDTARFSPPSTKSRNFLSSKACAVLFCSPADTSIAVHAQDNRGRRRRCAEAAPARADTVIEMTGDPHMAISVAGQSSIKPVGTATPVSDPYVPSGSMSLSVRDASGLKPGDRVQITRPVTPEWLHLMGMDTLVRNGKKQTWVSGDLKTERTIVAITGKKLIFDVPLTDSYDAKYLGPDGATVVKVEHTGQIAQVGVENFRLIAPARKITLSDKPFNGLQMNSDVDGWVRNLRIIDTTEAVGIGKDARRITVERVDVTQSIPIQGAAKPADFSANGTQILFDRCSATGDNVFYIAVGPGMQGPNVVLNCIFHGNGHVQPHQRWSTGILIDSCQVPEGGIDLMNRGAMGSGHGWTMGWGVVWNNIAKSFVIQMPPGSANWAIGNRGEQTLGKMPTFDPGPELPHPAAGNHRLAGTPGSSRKPLPRTATRTPRHTRP